MRDADGRTGRTAIETREGGGPADAPRRGRWFGPGLITGAADDDPSGIATYSQAGASFGFGLLWTTVATFPLMVAVQLMCARIGMVSGRGLGSVIREWYPRWILGAACVLLIVANVINIGADLGGMAAAVALLTPIPARAVIIPLAVAIIAVVSFVSYRQLASVLRWLTASLLAYVGTAFLVHAPWGTILADTLLPHLPHSRDEVALLVALFGTTISPYLFFWQAAEEVEEEIDMGRVTLESRLDATPAELRGTRADVVSGMAFSNLIAFFIILTTGATLFPHGVSRIATAADAAAALRPLAGPAASLLFGIGVFATGLLAIPVLGGSAAYAVAGALGWSGGMNDRPAAAPRFYAVFASVIAGGCLVALLPINAMKLLVWAAVVNGVLAPPLIILLLVICNDARVMGRHVNTALLNVLGGLAALVMTGAAVWLFAM